MKTTSGVGSIALLSLALPFLAAGSFATAAAAQSVASTEIGGEKLVVLSRKPVGTTKPEFTSVTVMPGRGMELLYVKANFPGKGEVSVLYSPDVKTAAKMLNEQDDANGDLGYRLGAAMLCPYPNRIIGKLSPDGKTLTTTWEGHTIALPANNVGKNPGAERHAMHGLILKDKAADVHVTKIPGGEEVTGVLHDAFHGEWFAKTDIVTTVSLTANAIDVTQTARNVGKDSEPMALGWHPYFEFPSGDHGQIRVHIPGSMIAQVNNYDSVFPTGKLQPVAGTQYDFRAPAGAPLDSHFYDDNWSHLQWENGVVAVRVVDPKARYGVAIEGVSPEIKTIQMYSPPTATFAAIEDQFNFADPFGEEWHGMDTGMVTLKPGESTKWHVRLRVFVP